MAEQKRLFLLDAYALIFRGYYAFIKNPRINSKGLDTSAILGFTNTLLDVIKNQKPDHLAVAFDKGGSDLRNTLFPAYKANRDATPEAIKIAVPYIQEILKAMHIPVVEKAGYEADDIIGTLAKQAEKEGFTVYMVTPDKDFAQLVSDNIFMYKPPRMGNGYEKWGVTEVQNKFEVTHPEQVIDYLGMMGDSADNIPGLPGVGDKTAKKFIAQYGSMENLFANIDQLKGKMKEKIQANQELGLLSKKLARILLDVPVTFNATDYALSKPDLEKTTQLFQELEFRRMIDSFSKIFAVETPDTTQKTADNTPKSTEKSTENSTNFDLFSMPGSGSSTTSSTYTNLTNSTQDFQYINSTLGCRLLLEKLLLQKTVGIALLTTKDKALSCDLLGIAFSWKQNQGYFVALPPEKDKKKQILTYLNPFFLEESIEKVCHDAKRMIKVLSLYQIRVKGFIFDTSIAHYLINPDMRHTLDVLSETYIQHQITPIEDFIGKNGKNQLKIEALSIEKQNSYTSEKASVTFGLYTHFKQEMQKANLTDLFEKVEAPLVEVLAHMEIAGINLHTDFLKQYAQTLSQEMQVLETAIFEKAGERFNLSSPKQLGPILFENLKLSSKPKKTKTGQYSTAEDVLSALAKEHTIVAQILEWRSLKKLLSTYVEALPQEIHPKTQRVHTVYNQAVAATGRLSSNNPNLQNIPIRTPRGQQVRKAFIAKDSDYMLMAADYSQIELRIIAALSQEDTMIAAFKQGEDIHSATAAKIFNVPIDQVTKAQRSNAKTVNFGIIYGVSAFGLSNQTDLDRKQAKTLIDTYYKTYPKLKQYIAKQVDFARENGYVETVLGRRRYLKDIHSNNAIVRSAAERNAVNAPIQGSAADIIKIAMIAIDKALKQQNLKSKMLLQVHDELVFDAYKPEIPILKEIIKDKMEHAHKLAVPLSIEIDTGENWLEAH